MSNQTLLKIAEFAGGQTMLNFGRTNRELRKLTETFRIASRIIPKIYEGFVIGKRLHLFLKGSSLAANFERGKRVKLRFEREMIGDIVYDNAPPGCATLKGNSAVGEEGELSIIELEAMERDRIQEIKRLLNTVEKAEIHYSMDGNHRTVPVMIKNVYVDTGDVFYGALYKVDVCPVVSH